MAASAEKIYNVTVTETKMTTIEVMASSSEEAKELVESRYSHGSYDGIWSDTLEIEVESASFEEDTSLCVDLSGTKEDARKVLVEYERQLQQACAAAEQMDKVIKQIQQT